jgi:hypothetical protein
MVGRVWGDRKCRVLSDHTLSFVITCLYVENKLKIDEKHISRGSDYEGVFDEIAFIFRK